MTRARVFFLVVIVSGATSCGLFEDSTHRDASSLFDATKINRAYSVAAKERTAAGYRYTIALFDGKPLAPVDVTAPPGFTLDDRAVTSHDVTSLGQYSGVYPADSQQHCSLSIERFTENAKPVSQVVSICDGA